MKKIPEKSAQRKKGDDRHYGLYFLASIAALYPLLFLFNSRNTMKSMMASAHLLVRIIPILLLVILFMGIMKYLISPKMVSKYVGKGSGIKGWALAISTGLLSHGPIYIWFPLLKELRDQGMSNGLLSVFLYNRAVKIPLLPAMIALLGGKLVVILLFYMLIASIIQGMIMKSLFD